MFGKIKTSVPQKPPSQPAAGKPVQERQAPKSEPPQPNRSKMDSKSMDERVRSYNELKTRIHRKLVEKLDLQRLSGDDEEIRKQVKEVVVSLTEMEEALLNYNERQRLVEEILDETFGLGPLEVLLSDPSISDILVNGPSQIYIERSGML